LFGLIAIAREYALYGREWFVDDFSDTLDVVIQDIVGVQAYASISLLSCKSFDDVDGVKSGEECYVSRGKLAMHDLDPEAFGVDRRL